MKKILIIMLFVVFLTASLCPALGSVKKETTETSKQEVSIFYYLQWAAIILIFIIALLYVLLFKLKGYRDERMFLSYLLIFLAIIAYLLKYHPEVEEFHEAPLLGLIKFFFALADGVLLTFYGFSAYPDLDKKVKQEVL